MHPGEKPYVVASSGQVELASRSLTFDAVTGIVMQLLPLELQHALDDVGAVEYAIPPQVEFPHEHFTVVVARGASDVWAEIRRKRRADGDEIHRDLLRMPIADSPIAAPPSRRPEYDSDPTSSTPPVDDGLEVPEASQLFVEPAAPPEVHQQDRGLTETVDHGDINYLHVDYAAVADNAVELAAPELQSVEQSLDDVEGSSFQSDRDAWEPLAHPYELPQSADGVGKPTDETLPYDAPQDAESEASLTAAEAISEPITPPELTSPEPPAPEPTVPEPTVPEPMETAPAFHSSESSVRAVPSSSPGVVLPMSRSPVRVEAPPPPPADALSGLERLLRTAAARGASTLYLSSDARPSVRVDGQLQILDSEPVHAANDVISLLLTLMPERSHEALRTGATTEWICDIEDIGRVRCMSFSDHRGPGGVFRLMPVRIVSVEQLGLPREVQSLAIEPEGLVLVVGPRSSGKRTLISALVDLINRTRRDHVITVEREVNIVHERGSSFVSQREVRGSDEEVLAAARAALREDPDVLVLEQVRTGLLMNVALEAAASGHLVIAGFSAHNAAESIDRILDLYAPEYARQVQLALADHLRGVVAQVLLPKIGGGRIAAREVLLNTAAVAGVIAEGKTSQLPMAIEGGRRSGMVPLNDSLVGYVRNGMVDIGEAYRHVADRPTFVELLKRSGVDTSAVERLA
jgi:twitching motility protein PilT